MSTPDAAQSFLIRQVKEWGEILSGFETRNKYVVCSADGRQLFHAGEVGGGFLLRNFLRASRPFTIHITTPDGRPVIRVERPFRFIFHKADAYDGEGRAIGSVQRRWAWLRRIYAVLDATGQEVYQLFGPILHPWTFDVRQGDRSIGKITKRWSGVLKEAFTDADNFGMTVRAGMPIVHQSLLLAAVFLIDFVHFENRGNRR